jgi:hypothetical protein
MCPTNLCATTPLNLRAIGRTTQIHINGHRGPAPLEPAAGVSRRLCSRGADSTDWSLHTAGPDNLDRATRLHLPGPADIANAGGVAWANQGWIMLKAETTAEPSRDGPGP